MKRLTTAIAAIFGVVLALFLFASEAEAIDAELGPVNVTLSAEQHVRGEAIDIDFEVISSGGEPARNVDIIVQNSYSECDAEYVRLPIFESTESTSSQDKSAIIDFSCGVDMCGGTGDRVLTIAVDITVRLRKRMSLIIVLYLNLRFMNNPCQIFEDCQLR